MNQLIQEDNQVLNKTVVYSYDAGGNLTQKLDIPYGGTGERQTFTYKYEDSNWKDKLTEYNGKPIEYYSVEKDGIGDIGNPKTYDGYTFTWEQGRQLSTIKGNGKDISFKYNVGGIRTEKKVTIGNGTVTTKYRLVGDKQSSWLQMFFI